MTIVVRLKVEPVQEEEAARVETQGELNNRALFPYARCSSAHITASNLVDPAVGRWLREYDVTIEIDDEDYREWEELQNRSQELFGELE
jgi:hypothetical protein